MRDRHECLAKQWPLTMTKVRGGSRRPAALTRTLGDTRIEIIGVLGEGSFAVVYSCKFDEDQRVAVKVERQVIMCRFEREEHIATRLLNLFESGR